MIMRQIEIKTPTITLNNLLKYATIVSSGGEAKNLIRDGEVELNGEVCTVVRKRVLPGDVVSCLGEEIQVVESNAD